MNRVPFDRRVAILRCLTEGSSIRSTERMTGTHRDTILRHLVQVCETCSKILDERMVNLPCKRTEVDEVWTFCGKKQRRLRPGDDPSGMGDQFVFTALDPESKIIPTHRVGKRNGATTREFIDDLAGRLQNRVQLSSDAWAAYADAIDTSFGGEVDYGIVVKEYEAEPIGPGRYAPPRVSAVEKTAIIGKPDPKLISTSLIECSNRTLRMRCRRFTRLTNAFSRKLENLKAAVALYLVDYNFMRRHATVRMTPAMAAGITDSAWTAEALAEAVG